MKILIVQDYLRSGGTERQSIFLANAFTAAGHPTTLLTFRPGGALDGTVHPSVDRRVLQRGDTALDWLAPRLSCTVQKLQPNIILCMGRMANCYAGRLQKQNLKSSVVASMRTGKPLPWLFRRSLNRVRHVVANSHEARSTLIDRHRVDPEKISVIHNSLIFPAEATPVRNDELRRHHSASTNTSVLLCVAMFRPEKNQRELIEIVANLPKDLDWQLWLAGDGPTKAHCEKLVVANRLEPRVIFPGFVSDPAPLYNAADIVVHASSSEALSNFFIEGQARGLPAIAYAVQGISETFVPGHTGWEIPRGDRAAFCQQIIRLCREPVSLRNVRAEDARKFARSKFEPTRQVARYLELFNRLA